MARWKFLIRIILIVSSFFLASGIFTYYPSNAYWTVNVAGFPTGFIHGVLAPILLIGGIFKDWTMYELNNIGFGYNAGFLFGLLFVWGGGGKSTSNVVKNYYSMPKSKENVLREKLNGEKKNFFRFFKQKNIKSSKIIKLPNVVNKKDDLIEKKIVSPIEIKKKDVALKGKKKIKKKK